MRYEIEDCETLQICHGDTHYILIGTKGDFSTSRYGYYRTMTGWESWITDTLGFSKVSSTEEMRKDFLGNEVNMRTRTYTKLN